MQILKNKYVIGFIILVSLLAFLDWIIFGRSPVKELTTVKEVVGQKIQEVANVDLNSAGSAAQTENREQSEITNNFNKMDNQAFKNWLDAEAQIMNNFNVNAEALTEKYKQIAEQMTLEQFSELAKVVQSDEPNANKKVLSAYLLAFAGYGSIADLSKTILSPLNVQGNPNEPHSTAEVQQTRERAMRVLLIDRFFNLAQGSNKSEAENAKQELKKLISSISDLYLRNYAQSKFNELSK